MSIDLMGLVRDAITPEAVNRLSVTLGETPGGTRKGLEGGVPAILAAMAGKSSSGEGISSLLLLFQPGSADEILKSFGPLLDGSGGAALIDFGNRIVQTVLGENAGHVADAISSQSGVRPASAVALLGVAAPLAIGAVCKASGSEGVTIASLLRILSSQKESFARFLPAGLGGVLGGAPLAALTRSPVSPESLTPELDEEPGALRRFWPFWACLAAMVAAGLIWSFNQETAGQGSIEASAAGAANGASLRRKLPNGTELNLPQMGMESRLLDFLEGPDAVDQETWFDFDRLWFATGSATLQSSSQEQLDNLANILRAYPSVKVRIGGYTDNVGSQSANPALSMERAQNVMKALVKAGVEPSRMTAQDNSSEQRRARNLRITLRVMTK